MISDLSASRLLGWTEGERWPFYQVLWAFRAGSTIWILIIMIKKSPNGSISQCAVFSNPH